MDGGGTPGSLGGRRKSSAGRHRQHRPDDLVATPMLMVMSDRVMGYLEMCQREMISLQRGMNFRVRGGHSVILMSLRPNAPYRDRLLEDGTVLLYEGHDAPRLAGQADNKLLDQPALTPHGKPTENGKFFAAARATERGDSPAERVQVYQKLRDGIWADNGLFHLLDAWQESDGQRQVFIFKLVAVQDEEAGSAQPVAHPERRRLIPTWVKLEVWKRDGGRCVQCGASDDLHFDHDLPYALGGASVTPQNVQLLCARHNLKKGARLI